MANNVLKVNGIAIASIAKINGETDTDIAKLNGEEFTGVVDAHTFIRSEPASGDSSITFAHGTNGVVLDSTYDVYEWHFINIHPQNSGNLTFQVNAAGGSGFNETITSSAVRAYVQEDGNYSSLAYRTADDQPQGNSYQRIAENTGDDNDESVAGVLKLYAPASTSYVKHFVSRFAGSMHSPSVGDLYIGGYINTTSAIDEIDFKYDSGNIDAGEIRMYGIAKS